ncbi:ATP-dependent zinc metalloprotease FtsH [Evtepia sp.]|uniref:ATP-dependent zinc metalloprotease FtsH n=1 Tax=Evtepia sp. TaxID=2773933 RepID=UPI003FA53564
MGKYGTITLQESGKFPRNGGTRPLNPNQDNKNNKGGQGPKKRGFFVGALVWALVLVIIFNFIAGEIANAGTKEVTYSEFIQMVENNEVATAELANKQITFYLSKDLPAEITQPSGQSSDQDLAKVLAEQMEKGGATCYITAPPQGQGYRDDDLLPVLKQHNVAYAFTMEKETSLLMNMLLSYVLPVVIMTGALIFIMRRMGGPGGLGGVGKSNAKVYMEKSTGVTFADVAGQDEAKESLEEIIDFLHNPGKYTEIGAKLPKGALLVGPPGTGKTLLAKAVAGEAGVPFFSISGSDFVEMFVGVGASRVRDLFKEANKVAPCIVFIDEIDTIGKSRDNRMGGNDEREQTLNQLLAEMDGFDPSKGVILLAATNRPEVLDQALLRPGRFDRRITIDRPNLAGRLATLQVHTRRIRLAEDVDLKKVALATAGCVGADLANLVNEAALRAVRLGRRAVKQEDLLAAFELVIAGTEKKGSVLTEFEKKLVAYHEVGHAMVAYKQKNTEPVQKITIVPHTQGSLGYTLLMPEEDKTELRTRDELLARIAVSMGGRAAEEVVMNTMTNGAAQDIQDATSVARNMVAMYGMSDRFGMMALASKRSQYLDGGYGMDCAQDTAAALDEAVRAILDQCYAAAVQIIRDSRQEMDAVVAYLLEKETITGAEMVAIIEGRDPAAADSPLRAEATAAPAAPAEDKTEDPPAEDKPAEEPPATDAPQDPPVTLEKSQEDEPPKEKP